MRTQEERAALRERALTVLRPSDVILGPKWLSRHMAIGGKYIGKDHGNALALMELLGEMAASDDGFDELAQLVEDVLERRGQQRQVPAEVELLLANQRAEAERRRNGGR
jgi:hypothetical protein